MKKSIPRNDEYRPLSFREKLFVNALFKTGKLTQAARDSGYSPKSPGRIARKPHVNRVIRKRLEEDADVTEVDAAKTLKKCLNATVRIYKHGRVVAVRPDYNTQLRAVSLMGRILGWYEYPKRKSRDASFQNLNELFAVNPLETN